MKPISLYGKLDSLFIEQLKSVLGVDVNHVKMEDIKTNLNFIDAETFIASNKDETNSVHITSKPLRYRGDLIFGYTKGKCVVSSHALTSNELGMVVLHEVGHLLGLDHCDRQCLMKLIHPNQTVSQLCDFCKPLLRRTGV